MYFIYILTNWNNRVLYTGVTNNLERRLYEHKHGLLDGFTKKYNVHKLVYFDTSSDIDAVIQREKQIKGWTRQKKNNLIESINPDWKDLTESWEMNTLTQQTKLLP
jgi:putative endonuclease